MFQENRILYRRRQGDWQTDYFAYVGLPVLSFADLADAVFVLPEIVKPRLAPARKESFSGRSSLDEEEGIKIFREALEGKTGAELENAAAELLLTSMVTGERSDWELFTAWVVHRTQPLSPRLIEGFARFYVARLNKALERAVSPALKEQKKA